jgi:hypothetical protein
MIVTQAECYEVIGAPEKRPLKSIEALEADLLKLPQVECPVKHTFGPGTYMREVFIPKGTFIIGHHHNFENINIFIKGHITFFTPDGEKIEMTAPKTFVGKTGRKIAYANEDVIWANVFSTNETDIQKLEEMLVTKSDTFKSFELGKATFAELAKEHGWVEENISLKLLEKNGGVKCLL